MVKILPLKPTPLGDVDSYTPSKQRPVRVRARSMPVDTHFEPHDHPWAQLAYCASGIVQVTTAQANQSMVTYIVPPSRAVWIEPGAQHHITVLEAAEFRTLYIHKAGHPKGGRVAGSSSCRPCCGRLFMHWTPAPTVYRHTRGRVLSWGGPAAKP